MEDKISISSMEYDQLIRDSEIVRVIISLIERGKEVPEWVLCAVCGLYKGVK